MSTSYPSHWETASLADIIEKALGGEWGKPPETADAEFVDVSVIRGTEYRNWLVDKGTTAAHRKIKSKSLLKRRLEAGNLVVEVSGGGPTQPVGRVLMIDEEAVSRAERPLVCSNFCRRVALKDNVNPEFIARALQLSYVQGDVDQFQTNTTNIRNLNFGRFTSETMVPLPPLDEQHRIVSKLESLFARSRRAKEALDAIPPLLDRLRQSILAAAFRGDLTADWRAQNPDVEPADKLLERIRTERRRRWEEAQLAKMRAKGKEPKNDKWKAKYKEPEDNGPNFTIDPPAGWQLVLLEDVLEEDGIFDGARDHGNKTPAHLNLRTRDYSESGVRVIRLENIGHLRFHADKRTYISHAKFEGLRQREIVEGDVVVGSFISEKVRVCEVPGNLGRTITKADCFTVRPSEHFLLRRFLTFFLASPQLHSALLVLAHGATRPRVTTRQLRRIAVPLCSLEEQREMSKQVQRAFASIDHLETELRKATDLSESLDSSVLEAAFSGHLLAKGDEQRSGHGSEGKKEGCEQASSWQQQELPLTTDTGS